MVIGNSQPVAAYLGLTLGFEMRKRGCGCHESNVKVLRRISEEQQGAQMWHLEPRLVGLAIARAGSGSNRGTAGHAGAAGAPPAQADRLDGVRRVGSTGSTAAASTA